jgi:hypothetical protein
MWQSVSNDMLCGSSFSSTSMSGSSLWADDRARDVGCCTKMDGRCGDTEISSAQVDRIIAPLSRALPRHNMRKIFTASEVASRESHEACPSHEFQYPRTRGGFPDLNQGSLMTWPERLSILLTAPATTDLTQDRDFIDIVETQAVPGYLEECATDATSCLGNLFSPH